MSVQAPVAPSSPFKGLATFEDSELDELLFFGRERDREVIAANLLATRLTVLYGPSGVGKSSVLRAGVARDLRGLTESSLVFVHDAWADDPAEALTQAIARAAQIEPGPLTDMVERAAAVHGDVFMLLDQLEAYFVSHGANRALGEGLGELLAHPDLPLHVLLSIREDALARLDAFKSPLPGLLENRLRLEQLTRAAGKRAIVGPIERFARLAESDRGLRVEPALVEAVLDGVEVGAVLQAGRGRGLDMAAATKSRIETPYLQLVMQRIWEVERAAGSRTLRLATLEELGGPARIVEEHLGRALDVLTPQQKELAARMFNHLVTPSGMKVTHGTGDLAGYARASERELAPVLDVLGRERIVRTVAGDGSEAEYEIFHDVLADAVLGWRSRFEAQRALAQERESARLRHRRLVRAVGVLVAALAAMAAITVYALSERSSARQSADVARTQRANALHQERVAQAQRRAAQQAATDARRQTELARSAERRAQQLQLEAGRQATIALRQRRRADIQSLLAERQKVAAQEQRRVAETQRHEAELQRRKADEQSRRASVQRRQANQQRLIAESQRRRAQQASLVARREKLKATREAGLAERRAREASAAEVAAETSAVEARTREDAYNAQALIGSDPDQSLELARQAAALDSSLPLVESTLRDALLATRVLHVLRGAGSSARNGTLLLRSGRVRDAEFDPAGTLVATAGDRDARLFDMTTGRLVATLATSAAVDAVSFSPDGRFLVTAGADGRALVWDTSTHRQLLVLSHDGAVTSARYSADGHLIATTSVDRTARIWDAATGARLQLLTHPVPVLGADFNADGSRLVTFTNDRTARLWDSASGTLVRSLEQPSTVSDARFSPSGDLIATTGLDGTARLWSASDGSLLQTLRTSKDLLASAFSPDGSALVTVGAEGDGRVWNVSSGALETVLVGHLTTVNSVAFSADGASIVTAGSDGSARIWSFPDGNQQAELLGHRGAIVRASFDTDGSRVVTASDDGTAIIWDAQVDRPLALLGQHDAAATGLAFSPNGAFLASSGADGKVRLWDLARRAAAATIDAGVPLEDVAYSHDGSLIAAAGADGAVRIWNAVDDTLRGHLEQGGVVNAVAFSPDDIRLATGGTNRTARITTLAGGGVLALPHPAAVNDVAFSPDGSLLATACADGFARLWDAHTGKLERLLSGHTDSVASVSFSADGRRLVTASRDHDVRIWDVASGQTLRVLHGHAALVSSADFSADGRWIVSAGPAKAGVWATSATDLASDRLFFLAGHRGPIAAVAFAPAGWLLATAGTDGTIRTYACALCGETPELLALARRRLAQIGASG